MTDVNQYKNYCTSDSKWEYVWGTDAPTQCPTNSAHTVDLNSIGIQTTVGQSVVTVREEDIPTGGHFRADTIKIDATGPGVNVLDVSWPIPISVLEIIVHPTIEMGGDTISVDISPQTTIGVLTSTGATGSTVLNVSPTVTQYTDIGYHICIAGHTGAVNNLGRVLSVDPTNGQITTEFPVVNHNFAPLTTAVVQDVYMMHEHVIPVSNTPFHVGGSKIGASYIPANTTIRCIYNNSATGAKTFVATVEYLY